MPDFAAILNQAHSAARLAVDAESARQPEDPAAFDCGFAWATVSGNEPLARWCRAQARGGANAAMRAYYGSKGYPNGHQWWKPGGYPGQSIRIHETGARAFRDALAEHGIVATLGSRLD